MHPPCQKMVLTFLSPAPSLSSGSLLRLSLRAHSPPALRPRPSLLRHSLLPLSPPALSLQPSLRPEWHQTMAASIAIPDRLAIRPPEQFSGRLPVFHCAAGVYGLSSVPSDREKLGCGSASGQQIVESRIPTGTAGVTGFA